MSTATARRDGNIRVQGLRKVFMHEGKELHVLKGIDVAFARGEMVSIQGRSGAGKSTFLHVLGTLDRPTAGEIHFGKQNVFDLSSTQLARFRNANIGFVFQFHHLLPEFTALENVMMPAMINRLPRGECDRRARELLESVGLQHRLAHKPGELSGGEQQRVALARALVMEPTLLLADEPTGNLDNKTGAGIHDLFSELNEKLNLTIVVVTHDPNLAESMPRRLYMEDGRLVREGTADDGEEPEGSELEPEEAAEALSEDGGAGGEDADDGEALNDANHAEDVNGEPEPDSGTDVTG